MKEAETLKTTQISSLGMKYYLVLIHSTNFTARLIQFGMFLWCILRLKKPKYTYNHCEIVYGNSVYNFLSSGAIDEGIKTRSWLSVRKSYNNRFRFQAYELAKPSDLENAIKYLAETENIPYEYSNFLYHAIKIFTGKWIGSTNKDRLYCYEHGLRFLEKYYNVKLDDFMNPYEAKDFLDGCKTLSIYKLPKNFLI